jgi:uncharacterized protein
MRARVALTFSVVLIGACGAEEPPLANHEIRGESGPIVERDIAVPMRDGVVLRADAYRPEGAGPFPVLVYRTPYDKRAAAKGYDTHLAAVARGYAVVLQDVRGRHASDGDFDPYRNEGEDGYDTIEWAAAQDWSNGMVGTYGLSYPGAVQWLAAVESPPHLKAMVPAMTFSSPRNFFYSNGVFDLSWLPWIYTNIAPDIRLRNDLPGVRNTEEARRDWPAVADEYRSWLPLSDLPYLRDEAPFYFEWLRHPPEDPWWDWAELRNRYDRVGAAVLNLSGWFDEAYGPEGAITNFNGLTHARRKKGRKDAQLILGPWTHGVHATMSTTAGDLDFGREAAIDYNSVILDFLDRYLRRVDEQESAPAVRYFVMGENRWREASSWPPEDARTETLFLSVTDDREFRLSPDAGRGRPSSEFVANPKEPVIDPYGTFGPHDYSQLAERVDVLTYDTPPLAEALTVAGAMSAVIYVACDCRDFDLWVRVQDLHPDGRAMNLMSPGNDVLRASYRDRAAGRQLLEPEHVYELQVPDLITSMRFAKGHRLRVQISASFAPHFAPNLQTGESEMVSDESRPARITVLHDDEHPSRLILPVVEGQLKLHGPAGRGSEGGQAPYKGGRNESRAGW